MFKDILLHISTIILSFSVSTLSAQNIYNTISFSQKGGVYYKSFNIGLHCNNNEEIYYTIDGSTPTTNSFSYNDSISLNESLFSQANIFTITESVTGYNVPQSVQKAIIIRAATFNAIGERTSDIVTNSYFIKSLGCIHSLPIVSICVDSLSLFDVDTGIFVKGSHWNESNPNWSGNYFQSGSDWERIINIEYFEQQKPIFNQKAGMRTHGGNCRRNDQKGISIYAREKYGKKNFKYSLFETKDIDKYKRFCLKPISSSWSQACIQDYICQKIASSLNVSWLAAKPIVLYLNGEYWGIYLLVEKPDERYLENNYGVNPDICNIMGNYYKSIENGSIESFLDLMAWITETDLSLDDNYNQLCDKIDISNYIDYYILELYIANYDWPQNNTRIWQEDNTSIWKWIFYDGDATLSWHDNVYKHATDTSKGNSTLLFRKLLKNKDFIQTYKNRLSVLLKNKLSYEQTSNYYYEITGLISDEIKNQITRWSFPEDVTKYNECTEKILSYLKGRPSEFENMTNNFLKNTITEISTITEIDTSILFSISAEYITVHYSSNKECQPIISITDLNGRSITKNVVSCKKGENVFDIKFNKQGVYVLSFNDKMFPFIKL